MVPALNLEYNIDSGQTRTAGRLQEDFMAEGGLQNRMRRIGRQIRRIKIECNAIRAIAAFTFRPGKFSSIVMLPRTALVASNWLLLSNFLRPS